MTTDYVRLIRRLHRSANALEVRALASHESGLDNDTAFQEQLAALHHLVVSGLASEHNMPKRVVLDLRELEILSDRMLGDLVQLNRFLRAIQTDLILVVTQPGILDCLKTSKLDRVLTVFTDPGVLRKVLDIELSWPCNVLPEEDSVTFTAAELREMEAGGLTLDDAIREIEATMPPE